MAQQTTVAAIAHLPLPFLQLPCCPRFETIGDRAPDTGDEDY